MSDPIGYNGSYIDDSVLRDWRPSPAQGVATAVPSPAELLEQIKAAREPAVIEEIVHVVGALRKQYRGGFARIQPMKDYEVQDEVAARFRLRGWQVTFEPGREGVGRCYRFSSTEIEGKEQTCTGEVAPSTHGAIDAALVDVFFVAENRTALRFADMPDLYLSDEDAQRLSVLIATGGEVRELGATPLPTAPTRARLLARAVALLERLAGSEVDAGSAIRPAGPSASAQDVRGPERP